MILLKIFRIKKEAIYNWYIGRIWGSIPPFSTKKKKQNNNNRGLLKLLKEIAKKSGTAETMLMW